MPSELQLDALREVANVGCGHAATALSRLVGGRRVEIELPQVWVRPPHELAALLHPAATKVVVASFGMQGDVTGRLLLVLEEKDADRLSEELVNLPSGGPLAEPHRDALAEAANIVASACLSAMGGLTGQRLVPSVPTILHDDASELFEKVLAGEARRRLVLQSRFVAHFVPELPGQLLVLPDAAGVKALLARLGV